MLEASAWGDSKAHGVTTARKRNCCAPRQLGHWPSPMLHHRAMLSLSAPPFSSFPTHPFLFTSFSWVRWRRNERQEQQELPHFQPRQCNIPTLQLGATNTGNYCPDSSQFLLSTTQRCGTCFLTGRRSALTEETPLVKPGEDKAPRVLGVRGAAPLACRTGRVCMHKAPLVLCTFLPGADRGEIVPAGWEKVETLLKIWPAAS